MESKFKTNLIILSKKGSKLGCFFAIVIFVPGIIGIVSQNSLLILLGFAGILLIVLIQIITRNKHSTTNNIQTSEFIEFDQASLTIYKNQQVNRFNWTDMHDIVIRIHDFKGEVSRASGEILNTSHGTLNYISFNLISEEHRYHFYLKDSQDKEALINLIENSLRPILTQSKRLKTLNIRATDSFYN
ncbi:hypothetical protein MATR_31060 [Marivirga tractuosa]|uniref:Uncharacterized protein n=1 Tax=Marivirga tractuosa (strain ATCC 23168 / DSM 4126 / NBRC 15989 / NCIMB 1408 / VKM B-1430 / H-43) TaxID=643867 RepID=E4TU23_MARTH|nr:hypothetical protein [Marivirga tractuosa]ADR23045.1 hypothetical protein Ftrac_3069 [Marivirga tractuosa DSM 4126]BDD16281.1 hypothetical protein MATR_31060 [Marivirga tractuosa]